ncbi:S1C family serine protease [Litorimonas sp. WD9-15]|uniref:S1C family serine protease n=1 Tax=Litorimonas sp. WD9-15 TaxID=3418716 RepID=UPI003D05AEC1
MSPIRTCLTLSCLLFATPVFAADLLSFDADRNVFTMAPTISKVTPGVVSINTIESEEADGTSIGGIGSGVIIDANEGLILTNDHVIEDAQSITVVLSDRRRYDATIMGQDPETDLALLRITAENLQAVKVYEDDATQVGDLVIAVGNPFGLSHTVTTGIVSAIGRRDDNPLGYTDLIQTDASINPGNSGGALVNSAGELIGINSAIVSRESGGSGIGFAIPAHTFRAVAEQLENYGTVSRGSLGVMITPVTMDRMTELSLDNLNGALIVEVNSGGAASLAGLRVDDVVTEFAGRPIGNSSDLRYAVGLVRPNTVADVSYIRGGLQFSDRVTIQSKGIAKTVSYEVILDDPES